MGRFTLNYTTLLDKEVLPRLHGNGFIQLDIPPDIYGHERRLNIWDPELEGLGQIVRTGIHDHRFSFLSRIIVGHQINVEYKLDNISSDEYPPKDGYHIYKPIRKEGTEDTKLERFSAYEYKLVVNRVDEIPLGQSYYMDMSKFHDTLPQDLTATIMTKMFVDESKIPSVMVSVNEEPDNEFDRDTVDKEILWDSIRKVFDLTGGIEILV